MNTPTRRRLLAATGAAGLASLAGCSAMPWGDDGDDMPDIDHEAVEQVLRDRSAPALPETNPLVVPDGAIERHRNRARDLIDAVPAEPSLPNEAVTRQLADDRDGARDRLDDEAEGRPLERLETWRHRRRAAANVRWSHRAATGEDDPAAYRSRRAEIRSTLASFEAEWDYRAPDLVAATVAHATLEELVDSARAHLDPSSPYPAEPRDAAFEVGDRWGALEAAVAETGDAVRLRAGYASGEPSRAALASAATRLEHSYRLSKRRVEAYVGGDESALDVDVEDPSTREFYWRTARVAEWRGTAAADARERHDHATAIVEAGRALTGVETLERVVETIEAGDYPPAVSVETIVDSFQAASAAVEAALDATSGPLAVALVEPAAAVVENVSEQTTDYYGSPRRVQGTLDHVAAYARVVPAATEFVADRLHDR